MTKTSETIKHKGQLVKRSVGKHNQDFIDTLKPLVPPPTIEGVCLSLLTAPLYLPYLLVIAPIIPLTTTYGLAQGLFTGGTRKFEFMDQYVKEITERLSSFSNDFMQIILSQIIKDYQSCSKNSSRESLKLLERLKTNFRKLKAISDAITNDTTKKDALADSKTKYANKAKDYLISYLDAGIDEQESRTNQGKKLFNIICRHCISVMAEEDKLNKKNALRMTSRFFERSYNSSITNNYSDIDFQFQTPS